MKNRKYPLDQILEIKNQRLDRSERVLKEKKTKHQAVSEDLEKARRVLDDIKNQKRALLEQRLEQFKMGITATNIAIYENYIKDVVDMEIKGSADEVDKHKKSLEEAREELEKAREDRLKKYREKEKIILHKKRWKKEIQVLMAREEARDDSIFTMSSYVRKKNAK